MRAVKKVIVLLSAVVLGCACLFTVGCANEELLQKIDSLAEKVETLCAALSFDEADVACRLVLYSRWIEYIAYGKARRIADGKRRACGKACQSRRGTTRAHFGNVISKYVCFRYLETYVRNKKQSHNIQLSGFRNFI